MRRRYLKVTWTEVGRGIRQATARLVEGKVGVRPRQVVYERDGFCLYVAGRRDELRLRLPSGSERRLRRFLRDFCRSRGGSPYSLQFYIQPWR